MLPTTTSVRHNERGDSPRPGGAVPAPMEDPIEPDTFATVVATAALEKKALDLSILDLRGRIDYADIFVLCSATNPRQVVAIADAVRQTVKQKHDRLPRSVEGMQAARWVLVDFGDVVLHVFDQSARGFYDLDGLWSDAERLPSPEVEAPEAPLFPLA